jgi:hypothetical protein
MMTTITEQVVCLMLEDRAHLIGWDTSLARALDFPAGHLVWCVWRAAKRDYEFFDATCAILSATLGA